MKKNTFLFGFHFVQYFVVVLFSAFLGLVIYQNIFFFPPNPERAIASRLFTDDGKTEMLPFHLFGNRPESKNFAPHFREAVRKELEMLFDEKDEVGELKYKRPDGKKWNIYRDGLKIYTSLNAQMQVYAEDAMSTHLDTLQPLFREHLKRNRRFPYSNDLNQEQVSRSIWWAIKDSWRYKDLKCQGKTQKEILKNFNTPTKMRVYSSQGELDTLLSPRDSILYYKSFLRAGIVSLEPQTGFVKAYVGGPNIRHFPYDYAGLAQRQVGSLFKPFVFATALNMGVVSPCEQFFGKGYCVGDWCPGETVSFPFYDGLIYTSGGGSSAVAVMSKMGSKAGTANLAKLMEDMKMPLPEEQITPPMCLGTMSLSLINMVSAYGALANNGIHNSPIFIYRIEDKTGKVLYEAEQKCREVLNENVAYMITSILKNTVTRGDSKILLHGSPFSVPGYPMAAKRGITQNRSDAWFVGMTPDLVTGVWTGGEERSIRWKWANMNHMGSLPIYSYFMRKVYSDAKLTISKGDFVKPPKFDSYWPECKDLWYGSPDQKNNYSAEPSTAKDKNPFL